ncbi:hypothetical protein [Corynebacterium sp. sy039]|uniref:hypothetical protein n=1 Tax=Corynebacterium sp. sy039 TaxID=2599641 RepID=UPI0011B3E4AC|nr:hypothetical protein [Corynebacterium sp. sy039]QDZ42966.1 hypothetical protein FQV43_07160 [Corynebacterium sp. sy039]
MDSPLMSKRISRLYWRAFHLLMICAIAYYLWTHYADNNIDSNFWNFQAIDIYLFLFFTGLLVLSLVINFPYQMYFLRSKFITIIRTDTELEIYDRFSFFFYFIIIALSFLPLLWFIGICMLRAEYISVLMRIILFTIPILFTILWIWGIVRFFRTPAKRRYLVVSIAPGRIETNKYTLVPVLVEVFDSYKFSSIVICGQWKPVESAKGKIKKPENRRILPYALLAPVTPEEIKQRIENAGVLHTK